MDLVQQCVLLDVEDIGHCIFGFYCYEKCCASLLGFIVLSFATVRFIAYWFFHLIIEAFARGDAMNLSRGVCLFLRFCLDPPW